MRVFKNNRFNRFARQEEIPDEILLVAVKRAECGQIDADLGGGVIKQRIARAGEGKRGGYRALILYRNAERAFFVYGFAKNDKDNIALNEKEALRKLAFSFLNLTENQLGELVKQGVYKEVAADAGQGQGDK